MIFFAAEDTDNHGYFFIRAYPRSRWHIITMETEIDIDRKKIVTLWKLEGIFAILSVALVLGTPAMIFLCLFVREYWWDFWRMFLLMVSLLGITGLLVLLVYVLFKHILPWFYRRRANALRYSLVSNALRVESGVLFKSRKTIPFDKITGLELVQGPLLRYLDIWHIKVQTASTGARMPEAVLQGVLLPEQVREDILTAKEKSINKR